MRYLTLDCETTTKNKGNPYTKSNKLCYVGVRMHNGVYLDFDIEYSLNPYGEKLKQLQEIIDAHDCIVGFNLKFDLHWLVSYGILLGRKRVFDTQLAEFIISSQSVPYPSLHATALHYGLSGKLDEVKVNYWDKGIDTPQVPEDVLREYLKQDVLQTWEVFCKQQEVIPDSKKTLISLANQDLLVLLDIERDGMVYDVEESRKLGDQIQEKLDGIDSELITLCDFPDFNPASGDHISAVLYGGSIKIPVRESYLFTYKDGRTAEKQRWGEKEYQFTRLVQPLRGSELKKEGLYSTNADTLASLRATGKAKRIISLLLERAKLEKLRGTYLHGLPELIEEMEWEGNKIHGTLNQCVAVTGRLSSTKPNLQNFDKSLSNLFRSRYV